MVWIPPGTFTMGSPPSERDRYSDEGPQTLVTISRGFFLGKYEVTQREYLAVMGSNPSWFTGDLDRPVERVSWYEAVAYCERLTQQERAAGRLPAGYEYRLPTEAQWEYACRAGTTTATAFGDSLSSTQANFDGNYPYNGGARGPYLGRTTKVGSYSPNAWGLYDMHGNVWEWCADWYSDSYPGGRVTDPQGPTWGLDRVLRGGGWFSVGLNCRSAIRFRFNPSDWYYVLGFRVALVPVP
jgi:formylglycine-generating enzyme required for sulfatase activity